MRRAAPGGAVKESQLRCARSTARSWPTPPPAADDPRSASAWPPAAERSARGTRRKELIASTRASIRMLSTSSDLGQFLPEQRSRRRVRQRGRELLEAEEEIFRQLHLIGAGLFREGRSRLIEPRLELVRRHRRDRQDFASSDPPSTSSGRRIIPAPGSSFSQVFASFG